MVKSSYKTNFQERPCHSLHFMTFTVISFLTKLENGKYIDQIIITTFNTCTYK